MPLLTTTDDDRRFMALALAEAEQSYRNGSVPVGSVTARQGTLVASGRNRARETNDPTSHGEIDCLRNGGMRPAFGELTLYTTLSPCMMCTGAMLFLGIPRVVIGDCTNYPGDVEFLLARGMTVTLLDDADCIALLRRFVVENADFWNRLVSNR